MTILSISTGVGKTLLLEAMSISGWHAEFLRDASQVRRTDFDGNGKKRGLCVHFAIVPLNAGVIFHLIF